MTDRYLRTGIFLAPFHALDENPTLALERDMELLQHLDRLNYHEGWVGEHHSGGFEIIASPEMFIAAAAERTRHIRLGTGVVSLPYHNPFMLASRMTQLDHMTRGRAMFGVGPGALVHDAAKIGVRAADQRSRMNEALDVIVELMAGKSVTRKTEWFDLNGAQLQLPSYSQPGMEMAVACARSPVGAVAAGRHGIGMLSIGGTSDEALKAHANNWSIYTENARQHGKTADRSKWRIVTFAHVAETREKAREDVKFGLDRYAKYFTDVATFPILPPGITDAVEFLTKEGIACIGTPDDCVRHFERLWQGSEGGFGAVLLLANNWADWPATLRSYELMARFVHPHFQRNANTLRQLSYDIATSNRGTYSAESQAAVEGEIKKYASAKSNRAAE
ncbi:limonene 1,2-monooxygenase [Enhydrobacter aerosaccus]|uniref:Limonene 1,2-monooxygenase n=1 Tax=Enhydrobacter aerosaccus TaxID=225324 RepID=A0A1T4PSM3_9HYPH|nr:LLM class flavin-dependent oxidoreductase [Enhydrobacter aerosaccus]SJZ94552.1 limonene 1,2-monooxygenase [Enhydrobacter aerosaccus]